jgi:3-phenylpropionate/trans-cinnamate dioxygenase ferredoxin subunit
MSAASLCSLSSPSPHALSCGHNGGPDTNGPGRLTLSDNKEESIRDMPQWVEACGTGDVEQEEVIRFDHQGRTFCIFRSPEDEFYCTDGLCTHEKIHLADGLVMDHSVECPKHNGVFDYRTGEAMRMPVCVNLKTFAVKVENDRVFIEL